MAGKAGRPSGESDARQRLLSEAKKLFVALPYSKVSTRMIAARADVNVALIRYYFENKAGLYQTMMHETMAPIEAQMKVVMDKGDFDSIGDFMRTYYRIMAPTPDMPKLMSRAMMLSPDDPQRQMMEQMVRNIARPATDMMFTKLQENGSLNPGMDPEKARMTFISLMVFPFLIPPAMLEIHGIEMNESYLYELAEHNVKVLTQGIFNQKGEAQ
ncbi:TetR family transcriptional regulator [Photobacterium jeanii]|uniref:TetR family transcriptional regulator n=1 Tax=Photobacterium jeanii TaxID=858640 RepID=A0A178KNZ4_9GAMM|nr:TetR/AcrR family transcriptional regulator [Photobacterium jeanii]OAN19017.1 TetR family transcriptional regulator [Photobacterium jeanii]PST87680.1 TetR/AcrR family transcriptional regulator [Photobacterium jeanii]